MSSSKNFISRINFIFLSIILFSFSAQSESIEGVFQESIREFKNQESFISGEFYSENKILGLNFKGNKTLEKNIASLSGKRLRLEGTFNDSKSKFIVESFNKLPEVALAKKSAKAVSIKNYKMATVLVNFPNQVHACKNYATVNSKLYGSNNSLISHLEHSSRGLATITPDANGDGKKDIFGPIVINPSKKSCELENQIENGGLGLSLEQIIEEKNERERVWINEVNLRLANSNINLRNYNTVAYIFPEDIGCGAGWANVGCLDSTYCRQTIYNCTLKTIVHEFGHNMGFRHTGTDFNRNDTFDNSVEKTNDQSSPMAYNIDQELLSMFNAPHQMQQGWLSESLGTAKTVTKSETLTLSSLERDATGAVPLVIEIPTSNSSYDLSVRSRQGEYYNIPAHYDNTLSVHRHTLHSDTETKLVDVLKDKEAFYDNDENIVVEVVNMNSSGATVKITVANQASTISAPTPTPITQAATVKICVDRDNDGWGWDGEKKCRNTVYFNPNTCVDFDNDGWGWNGSSSCRIAN